MNKNAHVIAHHIKIALISAHNIDLICHRAPVALSCPRSKHLGQYKISNTLRNKLTNNKLMTLQELT